MHKIAKAFIQIYALCIVALFALSSVTIIRFPYGADYGEAPLMDQVRRIESSQTLYKSSFSEPPYVIANYPPLYQYWVAGTNLLLKIPLFQAGRISSFLFSLISGYLIGLFTWHLTADKWLGIFGTALFWGHPFVLHWSPLARVDLMALALSLLGLWLLYRYRGSRLGLGLACLCFLASGFTRQTYFLAGPFAGFVCLWQGSKKRAIVLLFSLGISSLLIFGMINALTQGGFYLNIVAANINQYVLRQVYLMGKQLFTIWPVILISSVVMAGLIVYKNINKHVDLAVQRPNQAFLLMSLVIYFIGALITAGTIGKIGSNVNYFLELIAACAILSSLAVKNILDIQNRSKYILLGAFCIQAVWVLTYSFFSYQQTSHDLEWKLANYPTIEREVQTASQKGIVLSDDYMDMIVLSGQLLYYQPFEYGELYAAGIWDASNFIQQINDRQFSLIIVGGNTLFKNCCWPAPVIEALEQNYQIKYGTDVLMLIPYSQP